MSKRLDALKKALGVTGSKRALCAALWISSEELDSYLGGKKPVPEPVYQAAQQLIEKGAKPE